MLRRCARVLKLRTVFDSDPAPDFATPPPGAFVLLKGRRPEKFRDNINLDVSGAIQVEYCNDWRGTERVIEADEAEAVEVQAAPAVKALVADEPKFGTNR